MKSWSTLFDGESWKHYNMVPSLFSMELRNVRLELCTNEFNPFRSFDALFSYYPVILMVYISCHHKCG